MGSPLATGATQKDARCHCEGRNLIWPEGIALAIAGPDRNVDGEVWRNLRDDRGNAGWTKSQASRQTKCAYRWYLATENASIIGISTASTDSVAI